MVNEVLLTPVESPMVAGMTLYTSCFSHLSYASPDMYGRTWKSIASVSSALQKQMCGDGNPRNMDLQFKTTPSFSRKDGFALGQNTLTGPLSYLMGINGDMAFSVMALCQFTADLPTDHEACLFKFFANTINNNGLSFTLRKGTPVSNMIAYECTLNVGNAIQAPCRMNGSGNILFQPRRPYLFSIVKDYGRLQVVVMGLGGGSEFTRQVLLDVNVGAHEPLVFSNMDMTLNEKGNLNANLMAFAVFARALTDGDLTDWHKHYEAILKQFDPSYVQLTKTLQTANAATSCSFDAETCKLCADVKDWSNISDVLASGGTACLRAVHAYCTANPSAPRCECWNLNNPSYGTSCAPLRDAFSGVPSSGDTICPALPRPPASSVTTPDSAQFLKDIVTPDNIIAIGKAISEVQQSSRRKSSHHRRHHHDDSCCCSKCKPSKASCWSGLEDSQKPSDEELLAEGTGRVSTTTPPPSTTMPPPSTTMPPPSTTTPPPSTTTPPPSTTTPPKTPAPVNQSLMDADMALLQSTATMTPQPPAPKQGFFKWLFGL
jgi:hypothetical protein